MASVITKAEQEERRQAVAYHRADFRLEGIQAPPVIAGFEDQFVAGKLTPAQFRQACFAFAKTLAADPAWAPITPGLPE